MNNLVQPVVMSVGENTLNNAEIFSITEAPQDMLAILQNGAKATLKVSIADAVLLTQLEVDNQTFIVKLDGNIPLLQTNAGQELPVKIISGGRLQIIPEKVQFSNITPDVGKAIKLELSADKQLNSVKPAPLKLNELIITKLEEFNAPESIKTKMSFDSPELQLALSNIGTTDSETVEILRPLLQTLKQIASAPEQDFVILKNQLQQNISELVGQKIAGEISAKVNNTSFVTTDLGKTFFTSPLNIPEHEALIFTIKNAIIPEYSENSGLMERVLQLFNAKTSDNPVVLRESIKILSSFSLPKEVVEDNLIPNMLTQKLPAYNNNFLPNLVNFYRAATQNDITVWLGKDNIAQIKEQYPEASAKIINEFENFTASFVKETPMWRMVEIPIYADNRFTPLKIALKKDDSENQTKDKNTNGTRFVVETQFSRLGEFQFDGFVRSSERNLDLIIRTQSDINDDFCSQIINLFKNSLYNLDYRGNVKINRKEAFINFYQEPSVKQGIYI